MSELLTSLKMSADVPIMMACFIGCLSAFRVDYCNYSKCFFVLYDRLIHAIILRRFESFRGERKPDTVILFVWWGDDKFLYNALQQYQIFYHSRATFETNSTSSETFYPHFIHIIQLHIYVHTGIAPLNTYREMF